jgi:uncharacterized protein YlxP (DUF503 family)
MITLHLAASHSLKDKRQVVRSLVERLRRQYNVAIAEVEDQDNWNVATLGLACVSNDPRHANEVLDKVLHFVERERLDADVSILDVEVIPV